MENKKGKFDASRKKQKGGRYSASSRAAAKQPEKKRHSWKRQLLLLLPAIAIVVAALVAMKTVDHGSSYAFPSEGQQYYAGSIARIHKGAKMQADQEGQVTLTQLGQTTEVELPVYLNDQPEVVLCKDMLYYVPRDEDYQRILHFSHVSCTDASITVSRNGKSTPMSRGFLFDGDNTYIFLEDMVVFFNGYEIELPALSYVEAEYAGYMMIFNYDTKECIMELGDGTGTASAANGGYEISLLGDSLTYDNGEMELLVSNPELIEPLA